MTREDKIKAEAEKLEHIVYSDWFIEGAKWADENPKLNDLGRESLAITLRNEKIAKLEAQLAVAMKYIKHQSEYECYAMCGCQYDAEKCLAEIERLEKN